MYWCVSVCVCVLELEFYCQISFLGIPDKQGCHLFYWRVDWSAVILTKGCSLDLYLDQVLKYKHSAEPQIWGMVSKKQKENGVYWLILVKQQENKWTNWKKSCSFTSSSLCCIDTYKYYRTTLRTWRPQSNLLYLHKTFHSVSLPPSSSNWPLFEVIKT